MLSINSFSNNSCVCDIFVIYVMHVQQVEHLFISSFLSHILCNKHENIY